MTAITAVVANTTCNVFSIPGGFEKAIVIAVIVALYIQFYAQKHLLD